MSATEWRGRKSWTQGGMEEGRRSCERKQMWLFPFFFIIFFFTKDLATKKKIESRAKEASNLNQ